MTQMSSAAIAPRQPAVSQQDRGHPWFPIYQRYRSSMTVQLVEASSFEDWKYQREREIEHDEIASHARFPEFLAWMRENRGGARKCPSGNVFPNNFLFWLEGGRW